MNRALVLFAAVSGLALSTAACGGSTTESTGPAAAGSSSAAPSMSSTPMSSPAANDASMSGPVGPGCADYAKAVPSGAGSVDGMAKDPVAVAASNNPLLTKVLTYHVVPGQISPDKITGEQTTVEGSPVTVAGTPDNLTVNGNKVICGGVHTANATVYLIDGVLTPKA